MNNNFLNNLFGTIAGHAVSIPMTKDFIPINSDGGVLHLKGEQATWLGLQNPIMQKYAYDYCYAVAAVADKLADMDVDGKVAINNIKGKGKEKPATGDYATRIRLRLEEPNPFQSWEQFRGQQVMYKRVFGFCPVLPLVPAGFDVSYTTQMVNLPPWMFSVKTKPTKGLFNTKVDVIEKYVLTLPDAIIELDPETIILLEDSYMPNYNLTKGVLPQSKLVGLDMAVSNLCAAMEADNVLLRKKGPLGFISHDAAAVKDSVTGYLPMTKKEKIELQGALQQYGMTLQQYQYVISRQAVRWNPMSFDVKQLGTKETIVSSEKIICKRMGYPHILFEESDATFANGDNAAASVYQTNVIPNNTKDFNKYNKFYKTRENGIQITGDFTHVAALQEDVKMAAETNKINNETLQIDWENNLITLNQWRVARGYDEQPDGDVYKKDLKTEPAEPKPDEEVKPTNENGNDDEGATPKD